MNATLEALAAIDKEVAEKEGVVYADVFGATMAAMTKAKARYGEKYLFDSESGDRPTDACKLVMAHAFLKALGFTEAIGTISVDYAAGTAAGTPGQKIVAFKDRKLTIESAVYPFHFPGYPSGRPDPDPILACVPFNDEVNRYGLVVKNLPTARTKVYWADEEYDFASADLARGVNLTGSMLNRAFAGLTENVTAGVNTQQQQERAAGMASLKGTPDPEANAKHIAALQAAKAKCLPKQHTITLQPLAQAEKQPAGPIPVIVDTDMCTDCDDVGALALINTFMNQGEATLLACVANTHDADRASGATIQAINAYYGHPAVPIGAYHGETGPATKMTSVREPAPAGSVSTVQAFFGRPVRC